MAGDGRTLVTLWTETKATELLALSFAAQIKGVGKFALIAFFAETALVVLADEMTDAGTFVRGSVVAVRTGGAEGTVAVLVGRACGAVVLVWVAKWWKRAPQEGQEGETDGSAGGIQDEIGDGSSRGGHGEGGVGEGERQGRWVVV